MVSIPDCNVGIQYSVRSNRHLDCAVAESIPEKKNLIGLLSRGASLRR